MKKVTKIFGLILVTIGLVLSISIASNTAKAMQKDTYECRRPYSKTCAVSQKTGNTVKGKAWKVLEGMSTY